MADPVGSLREVWRITTAIDRFNLCWQKLPISECQAILRMTSSVVYQFLFFYTTVSFDEVTTGRDADLLLRLTCTPNGIFFNEADSNWLKVSFSEEQHIIFAWIDIFECSIHNQFHRIGIIHT
jgi:hypothetical protein